MMLSKKIAVEQVTPSKIFSCKCAISSILGFKEEKETSIKYLTLLKSSETG
jgi:hypothetical protein